MTREQLEKKIRDMIWIEHAPLQEGQAGLLFTTNVASLTTYILDNFVPKDEVEKDYHRKSDCDGFTCVEVSDDDKPKECEHEWVMTATTWEDSQTCRICGKIRKGNPPLPELPDTFSENSMLSIIKQKDQVQIILAEKINALIDYLSAKEGGEK